MSTTMTVALDGDALPCADCGQAVSEPDPATLVNVERVHRGRVTYVPMAKCSGCVLRDRGAADLAIKFLRTGVTRGDRRYSGKGAIRLLIDARAAFDAAGVEPRPVEGAAGPAAALTAEVEHLSALVAGLRWRDRLNPPASIVAEPLPLVEPGTANLHRWGHLDEVDRARLREGTAKVLAERIALLSPPVALPPPPVPEKDAARRTPVAGGCLYCGLGSITMSARAVLRHGGAEDAAWSVWTLQRVNPTSLGARRGGPSDVVGWLCPACESAAAAAGSASHVDALPGALSTFLGVSMRTPDGINNWVVELQGWGALVVGALCRGVPVPPPNIKPWGHLTEPDLRQLADEWRRGGHAAGG